MADPNKPHASSVALVAGLLLIAIGLWNLIDIVVPDPLLGFAASAVRTIWRIAWPCALVAAGGYLLWASKKGKLASLASGGRGPFRRSRADKRLFGICGGIAYYFGVDSTMVRIIAVILLFLVPPTAIVAYLVVALLIPPE